MNQEITYERMYESLQEAKRITREALGRALTDEEKRELKKHTDIYFGFYLEEERR